MNPSQWKFVNEFVKNVNTKFFDINPTQFTFWGSNVVQMQTMDTLEILQGNHLATLKVDGERQILILFVEKDKRIRALSMTRTGQMLDITVPEFCRLRPTSTLVPGIFSIFDCEYLLHEGRHYWIVFDCLVFRSIGNVRVNTKKDFVERKITLTKSFEEDFESDYIRVKNFIEVDRSIPNFTQFLERNTLATLGFLPKNDGIIFQPKHGVYPVSQNMNLTSGRGLKWKPECTLDLIAEKMTTSDIQRVYNGLYGRCDTTIQPCHLLRPYSFYGSERRTKYGHIPNFEIPSGLCKLKCIADFSFGTNALFQDIVCHNVPLCIQMNSNDLDCVKEFSFDSDLNVYFKQNRTDKIKTQVNKARTVAGVLWQAKRDVSIDDIISGTQSVGDPIQINIPESVKQGDFTQPFDDFITGLQYDVAGSFVENEFKLIQTKRPRSGNLFPSENQTNYQDSPFVDVLHFQRAKDLLLQKYQKAEPPVVTSIDLFSGDTRITAYERVMRVKSGKELRFYETSDFQGIRKTATGVSHIVQIPDVEAKSGYVFRLDSRSEVPKFFYDPEMIPENQEYHEFLSKFSSKKRNQGTQYVNYRFVDRQDLSSEIERNIPLNLVSRVSTSILNEPLVIGDDVQVNYHNSGKLFSAKIVRVDLPGRTCDVKYNIPVHLNFHTNPTTIPLCVDSKMLRVKKRQSVEFPGFRVEFTKVKMDKSFKSSESKRLYHLPNRCDHHEIEIELLASIGRNPHYITLLKQVMVDLFTFMKLDENSFLFDSPPRILMNSALKQVLQDHAQKIGQTPFVNKIFQYTLQNCSRYVPESDWYSMIECDSIDPSDPWADLSQIDDYSARIVFQKNRKNHDLVVKAGYYIFGHHSCFSEQTFMDFLQKRLRFSVLHEIDESSEVCIHELKRKLHDPHSVITRKFLQAPMLFGATLCKTFITDSEHAWWDEQEVAVVWNDVLHFAIKFANAFYYGTNPETDFWETSEYDVSLFELHRDIIKFGVIVGFIDECRRILRTEYPTYSTNISEQINLASIEFCNSEYSRYTQREFWNVPNPTFEIDTFTDF